jgi:ATP-dependent DNA helicase RecQ
VTDETVNGQATEPTDFPVQSEVEHRAWGRGTVMSTEEDRITVFFRRQGYKVLSLAAIRKAGLVSQVPPPTGGPGRA